MNQSKRIKVGLIQPTCSADRKANERKAEEGIRKAASMGAQVVCLEELFLSTYFCVTEDYAAFELGEPVPGPSTETFGKLASELSIVIVASLFEKRVPGLFHNTVAVLDADGSFLGRYRKHHIPDDPGFYEKFFFTPGDEGYKVFDTRFGRIGTLICWDQWYPEAARITSLMGAQVIFYPTAIGWALSQADDLNRRQYEAWQTIQRGHAVANGIYAVSVNRTGIEAGIKFWGGSFVADPFGAVLYSAPHDREDIHVEELDLSLIDETRVHWPFLRDRRIDSYKPVLKRFID